MRSLTRTVLRLLAALGGAVTLLGLSVPVVEAQTAHYVGAPAVDISGATLRSPFGVSVSSSGEAYIGDTSNSRVLQLTPSTGLTSTVYQYNASTDPGCQQPEYPSVDSSGNVYFVCGDTTQVFKVPLNSGAFGTATALFSTPGSTGGRGTVIDSSGYLWIVELNNNSGQYAYILRCPNEGANGGNCTTYYTFPSGSSLGLSNNVYPAGLAEDSSGNFYIDDINNKVVWKLSNTGTASSPVAGTLTDIQSCPVASGQYSNPGGCFGVVVDANGVVYMGSNGPYVYKLTPNGSGGYISSTVYPPPGLLHRSVGIALDPTGTILYAADFTDGSQATSSGVTGPSTASTNFVQFAASGEGFGNVAVGSTGGTTLSLTFSIDTTGTLGSIVVSTQGITGLDFANAGTGTCTAGHNYTTAPTTCTVNVTFTPTKTGLRQGAVELLNSSGTPIATALVFGTGTGPQVNFTSAALATLDTGAANAEGIVSDAAGNLYIAAGSALYKEAYNSGTGTYTRSTLATTVSSVNFSSLQGLAIDGAGNLYLGDGGNNRIIKETLSGGTYTPTVICSSGCGSNQVAVDLAGNVYFLSGATSAVEKLTYTLTNGVVSYTGPTSLQANGNNPWGIAVDPSGNIFYTTANSTTTGALYKLTSSGSGYVQTALDPTLNEPTNISLDTLGNIYIAEADGSSSALVKETYNSGTSYTRSTLYTPNTNLQGVWVDAGGNVFATENAGTVLEYPYATPPSLVFATTNEGSSTTTTTSGTNPVTLQNVGNASLSFPIPSVGTTDPSVPTYFSLGSSTCPTLTSSTSSAGSLAVGATCNYTIDFAPTVGSSSPFSGSVTLTDNNLNATNATQSIQVSGQANWLAPSVTGVTPSVGPNSGGTTVTVSGTNLSGATAVNFGGTAGTIVTDTPTALTVTSPAISSLGTVDITVTTPGGTSATSSADHFTYQATPTVTLTMSSGGNTVGTGGSIASGNTLKLTATVKVGTTAVNPGIVAFCNASASRCTDVDLLGTAELTTAGTGSITLVPSVGVHSYKAVFLPTGDAFTASSGTTTITINPASTQPTTTTIQPATGSAGNYTLSATVTSTGIYPAAGPTGAVNFLDTTNSNANVGPSGVGATLGTASVSYGFASATSIATGTGPQREWLFDYNNDGKLDLAVANTGGNTVTVYTGNGNGTFNSTAVATISTNDPTSITAGDFNGDGYPDLAVASYGGNTVIIYTGNGSGTFTLKQSITLPGSSEPVYINIGDFNNDGVLDFVTTSQVTNAAHVYLGNGDGTFTLKTTLTFSSQPSSAALGDFNGDGKLDMAIPVLSSGTAAIYLGNGDGTFTLKQSPSVGTNPHGSVAADFNGDGILDLAVANNGSASVTVLQGAGDGTFTTSATLTVPANPDLLSVGDFNGDGIADIVVGNTTTTVLTGSAQGSFTSTSLATPLGQTLTGDLNGDGLSDVVGLSGSTAVSLLAQRTWTATASASGVAVAGSGNHSIEASYAGDSNYASSISSSTDTLVANALPTVTLLSTNVSSPQTYGTSVTITAQVSPSSTQGHTVTGDYVTFMNGSTTLCLNQALNSSGQASCTTTALPASTTNSLTAVFTGDTNFATSTSSAMPFTVNQASQTISFTPTTSVTYGVAPITLTATGGASGNAVTFSVVSGPGTISGSTLTVTGAGSIVVAANQAGNTNYAAAAPVTRTIMVNSAATTTSLSVKSGGTTVTTVTGGSAVTLSASVTANGSTLTSGTVTFCDATATYCTDIHQLGTAQITSAGTATITLVPSVGSHSYSAVYLATANNLSSTSASAPLSVTGGLPSSTTIAATGSVGNYTLTATVTGNGSQTTAISGNVNFTDVTNGNAAIGTTATLGTSTPSAFFVVSNNTPSHTPYSVAAVDLNGDGKLDLVESNLGNATLATLLGNGDGTFATPSTISGLTSTTYIAVGDFNNDGKPDVAVTLSAFGQVTVLLGNGDGTLTEQSNQPTVGSTPQGIVAGDFNRDGKLDLAVANSGGTTVSILLGNGDGTFSGPSSVSVGNSPERIGVGDFNGDGILDLAVSNFGSNSVTILLGNGDGTFTAASASPATGTHPVGVAVADFNGDGNADLAVTNAGSNSVTVLLGHGDGTFTATSASPGTGNNPRGIAVGDFNSDGKVDLAVANYNDGTVNLLLGNGDGTFAAASTQNGGYATNSVAVGDLNGDGTADIVAANYGSNSLTILLNEYTETATASISNVSLIGTGTHNVQASYGGSSSYAASVSATTGITAQPVTTTLSLTANPSSSTYGQSVTLIATLAPYTAGGVSSNTETVTFYNGAAPIGTGTLTNGVATLTLSTLPAGTLNLQADYAGDTNLASSNGTLSSYAVAQAAKTITFPALANSVAVNATATLAATTSNGDPVTYSITAGSATISGTTVTFSTAGSVTITVNSAATSNYAAAAPVYQTITVNPASTSYAAPTTAVGSTSTTQTATINIATAGTLSSIAVLTQGRTGLDFSFVTGGTCSLGTAYTAGQACTVEYTFSPLHPWLRYGGITLSSSGGTLMGESYLTGTGTGPQVIYSSNQALSTLSTGFFSPKKGIAVDAAGNVFLADAGHNAVTEIPYSAGSYGSAVTLANTGLFSPEGVAVDGVGNLFFADTGNNTVKEIPLLNGTYGSVVSIAGGFFSPEGVAVDSAGNVYVADTGHNAVKQIPFNGGTYGSPVTLAGSGLFSPEGIAVDSAGNVYFADTGNNAIKQIPFSNGSFGSTVTLLGSGLFSPEGVAVDGSGNVYFADTGHNAVKQIPYSNGSFGSVVTLSGGFSSPEGVTVDGSGNVFIEDTGNNAVKKLDYADAPSLTFPSTPDGSTSATQSVIVTNNGNVNLSSSAFTISSSFESLTNGFSPAACLLVPVLASGSSCSLNVAFVPTGTQTSSINGTAVFTDNNLNATGATQTINLSGAAVGLPVVTGVSPAFGPAAGGTQVTITGSHFTGTTAVSFGSSAATNVNVVSDISITANSPAGTGTVDVTVTTTVGPSVTSSADQFLYQIPQTITFTPASPILYGASSITLTATGGASGNPVTFTLISGPATLSGSTLTVTGVGTIVLHADQAGNSNYTAAPTATASIIVNPGTSTITFPTLASPVAVNATATLAATVSDGDPVTYSITAGSATISGSTITYTNAGTVTIAASYAGNANYSAAQTVSQTINVNAAATAYGAPTTAVGSTSATQTATVNIATAGTLGTIYVVTQGATGLDYNAVTGGTCTTGTAYSAGQACTVEYNFAPIAPGRRLGGVLLFDNSSTPVLMGESLLHGTGTGPQALFSTPVATTLATGFVVSRGVSVDGSGNVYLAESNADFFDKISPSGTVTQYPTSGLPTATAVDGAGNVFVASQNYIYKMPFGSTTLSLYASGVVHSDNNLVVDSSGNLYITQNGAQCLYKFPAGSPNSYSTLFCSGTYVSGVPTGRLIATTIDANDNLYLNDFTNSRVLEVAAGTSTPTVAVSDPALHYSQAVAVDPAGDLYVATANGLNRYPYSNGSYGSATSLTGYVAASTGAALGQDGTLYLITDSTLYKYVRTSTPALTFPSTNDGTTSATQSVVVENDGNATLVPSSFAASASFTSVAGSGSPAACSAVASVAAGATCGINVAFAPTGTQSGAISGTAVLTDNNLNVLGASQTINLTGTAVAAPVVTGISPTYGPAVGGTQITITGSYFTGATVVSFGANAATNVNVVSDTQITATAPAGSGTVDIHVTTPGGTSAAVSADQFLYQIAQTITFAPASPITFGGSPITLTATGGASGNPVTFTLVSGPAVLSGNVLNVTGPGTIVISANQAGNANYSAASTVTANIQVQAVPSVTWPTPAAITYGTPLSATQLDAASPLQGTFVYTPGVGTVLAAGSHTLSATFTPGDAVDYTTRTVTVPLTVNMATPTVTTLPTATTIVYGQTLTSSTLSGGVASVAGTFAWTTGSTAPSAGTSSQSVTFTPADTADYNTVTFTVQITVTQATPSVSLVVSSGGNPATSVAAGSEVTLTATVLSGSTPVTLGTVNFCNANAAHCTDINLLGTAQLTGSGTAVVSFYPGVGSYSYKAVYVGTVAYTAGSSSSRQLTVTGASVSVPYATTTSITPNGSVGNYSLMATVTGTPGVFTPLTGSVSFLDASNGNASLGNPVALGASTPGFSTTVSANPVGGGFPDPSAILLGDFNHDGKLDAALNNIADGSLTFYLGNGDGTFTRTAFLSFGSQPYQMVAGDFNNDGNPDIATGLCYGSGVSVVLGNGDGTFGSSHTFGTGDCVEALAEGDFNGDGNLDLIAANRDHDTVTVLLGNGNGGFNAAQATVPTGNAPSGVAVGDFNGDGQLDFATANYGDDTVTVALGNGDGTFTVGTPVAVGREPQGIGVADFNGDGNLDIVVSNVADGTVSILLGNGHGAFATQATVSVGNSPQSLAVGDLDGDGHADIVTGNYSGNTLSLLLGHGDGTFTTAQSISAAHPVGVMIGDLNGDGQPDLFVDTPGTSNSTAILLTGKTETATATATGISPVGTGTHNVAASYPGDSNYAASVSATTPLTAQPVTTNVVLIANPSGSTYGQQVTLTAYLAPYTAQGHSTDGEPISFYQGSTLLGTGNLTSGTATLTTSALPAGTPGITAVYSTDGNFASSNVTLQNYNVAQATKTINFPTLTNPVAVNATATLAATTSNGDPVTYSITAGSATISGTTVTFNTAGSVTIAANSAATANYAVAATVSQTINVNAAATSYAAPTTAGGSTSATQTATVNIATAGTLGTIYVVTQGATGLDYNLVSGGTCAVGTAYSAGQACTVDYTFTPLYPGRRLGGVLLFSNASTPVLMGESLLHGTGTGPQALFSTPVATTLATGFANARGVSVDGSGNVYLAEYSANFLDKVSPAGTVTQYATPGLPTGTAVDGAGNVFVYGLNYIDELPFGSTTLSLYSSGVGNPDNNLVVDSTGDLFATQTNSLCLYKFPATPPHSYSTVFCGGTMVSGVPTGRLIATAIDANDNLYLVDYTNGRVLEVAAGTSTPVQIISDSTILNAQAIAVDAAGDLYVGTANGLNRYAYANGSYGAAVALTGYVANPKGATMGGDGTLYLLDNSSVYKNVRTSTPTLTFPSTNDGTTSATQSVVVENDGNAALVPSSVAASSSFISVAGSGSPSDCRLVPSVASGATCGITLAFAPTNPQNGTVNGTASLSDNNLNVLGASQTLNLTGTAVGLPAVTGISPAFGPAAGGTPVTLTGSQFTGATAVNFGANAATNVHVVSDNQITATAPAGTGTVDVTVTTAVGTSSTSSADRFLYQIPQTITFAPATSVTYGIAPITLSATGGASGNPVTFTLVSGPATLNGSILTVTGAGTIVINADQAGNSNYTAAPTVTVSITVNQATPTITWATPANITYGTALSSTQLDATSSVAGTFSYTPALGAVPAAGTDTLSVTFTPTDTADYNTATTTVQLVVGKATPALTWATPAGITYGTALSATQLDASSSIAGTFSYTPALGAVPAAGTDTLSVTFTPTDTADYNTATATVQLVVGKATPTLTWATPAGITYGTALSATQLDATSSVAGTFSYTPALGAVPAAGTDTLSVTFTPTDTADYNTATTTVQLVVGKATPALTWATPAGITYGTALSATQLDATSSVPGTFSYTPAIGTIPTAGTDTLSVTFTPTDTADYNTATATVQLVVGKATPTLTWATPAGITYGTALSATQLDATSSVAGTFSYTPALGAVPAAGTDTLSVTFTPTDTADYNAATTTVQLVVGKATPTLTWATPASITYGTGLSATQLDATGSVPGTFSYTPALGAVPAAGTDTLSVTFTPTDTADYNTATTTVQLVVGKATPTLTWATPASITYGTALSATQLDATSSVPGTFSYTPALGAVPAAGTDTLSVTFTPTDTADYNTATTTVQLVVGKATPALTWATPASVTYGTALSATQLNATSSVTGTFSYTPALGAVPAAGTDTLSVTFTPTDTADYNTATTTVQLVVGKATPTITWATPASITYGTALSATQLNATSSVAGTFSYTPALGAVPPAGTDTLSVTFTPTDTADYNTATTTVQLVVGKATPTITWATPASITYGTALSATQLNATSSVTGTFSYTPALGTVPTAGTDTLSVTFTPTDTADYNTATTTVQLVVGKATPTITWATPASITYGTALSATQLNATSSVTGTFSYTPALGTVPTAGTDTLSVTFTPTDTADYNTATTTVQLVVGKATPSLTWATPASLTYGTALSATQLDASSSVAGTFSYSPAIGAVPPAGTDTLSVTFTPTDTADYNTATTTVQLTVGKATPTLTWATPASITYGTALSATQLNATSSVAGTFSYTPALGAVPVAGTDTLSVTFTPTDTADSTTAMTTVQLVVGKATPSLTWATPAGVTYGTALSATQLDATASVPGTFSYSPALGAIPPAGTDTLSVTFTPTDTADYTTATTTVQLGVGKATPTLTWAPPAGITYGTALSSTQLDASSSVAGSFVYSPAIGTVQVAGTDTLSVTFTPTDTADYTTATTTVQLVVGKATPTLTWATPASITYGTALSSMQLDATSSVAGTFSYTPAIGAVPPAGTDTLSVTFTPTDTADYNTATTTVQLSVGKSTPTITWATPASVTYGTALSATQLDATANVPGTFSYTPALGAVPSAGIATLSVTFTPNDTVTYNTVTATVQLTVANITPTVTLTASANPVFVENPITLTAVVAAPTGVPSGAVIFFDGTTILGTASLSGGAASFTTSSLLVGSHTLTVTYEGDSNFNPQVSPALIEQVQDFGMGLATTNDQSQSLGFGGSAYFHFALSPLGSQTFAAPIVFTVTGLPDGATATFSPATLAAGSGATDITMTVVLPAQSVKLHGTGFPDRVPPLAFALLLLPLAAIRSRARSFKRLLCLLLVLGGATSAALLGGCGNQVLPQNYTLTVTATSGKLARSTTVNLAIP